MIDVSNSIKSIAVLCGVFIPALVLLKLIFDIVFKPRQDRSALLTDESIRSEHGQLVKEGRLLEAKEVFLDNYNCFDRNCYREWECRLGEARIGISNKNNLDALFRLSLDLCHCESSTSTQRQRIQESTYSILMARTRFLLDHRRASKRTSDARAGGRNNNRATKFDNLLELWKRWLCFLSIYSDLQCSDYCRHKKVFHALNRALCKQVEKWRPTLDVGRLATEQAGALGICKHLIHRKRWEVALLQHRLYVKLCSANETMNKEPCLLLKIQIKLSLAHVHNREFVADAFVLAKRTISAKDGDESGRSECVSLLFDLLESRTKRIFPAMATLDVDFHQGGMDQMKAPFLVRLEVAHLWQEFLKVCEASCHSKASPSFEARVLIELSNREKDPSRARLLAKFVPEAKPSLSD